MIAALIVLGLLYLGCGLVVMAVLLMIELQAPAERLGAARRTARCVWHLLSWPLQLARILADDDA